MYRKFTLILLVLLALTGCASPAKTTTNFKLPMGYIPNIQFAPFYVALDKGYFAAEGIDLTFDYSFETDGIALVGAGKTPFSLASGDQFLLARAQGLPITYVYSWYKEYPVTLVSTDPSVKSIADLRGKRIALPGLYGASYVGLRALLAHAGLQESDVTLNSIGYTQVEAVTAGKEQNVVGYTTNEPILLQKAGVKFTAFNVGDAVDLASNGIVTNEQTISTNPELVKAFIRAFDKGLRDTIADPQAAFEISKKYVEGLASADQETQMAILERSIASWKSDMMGKSNPQSWQNMQKVLLNMGMLTKEQDLSKIYSNDFLAK